ncbi:helix-turn-helix domain-containing protein [Mycobacterium kubicae]|uniref:Helix-turn-helix domain-containing protein n=1 Tax=Mycobacterium kubicae TaxID=120959 RepID=A0AAX1JK40_9MYCO|nr:helix-turn-helix domain-containing protein [Mycobacterium kubicae]QNI14976.1 helix-turn-helix domain-containing protein [Mycobacterium kubicae]QPI40882.1 helix-turn-helix domain-containing protein [Mycobacterium kubicae]
MRQRSTSVLACGASYLSVSPKTLRRFIADQQLVAYRVGRQWRVPIVDLDQVAKGTDRYW